MCSWMSERVSRGFILARRFSPEEFEQLRVPASRVLNADSRADTAALKTCDCFVDHGADGAVFVAADDAGAAGAVEEDARVYKV